MGEPAVDALLAETQYAPLFSAGGLLVWHDNVAMNYSNWGQHDTGPNMLSPNSCYWIQSSDGVWGLGSCSNVTMGVICKTTRGKQGGCLGGRFLRSWDSDSRDAPKGL